MRKLVIFTLLLIAAISNPAQAKIAIQKEPVSAVPGCQTYYKNHSGEVYQLPTEEYLPACQCSTGFMTVLSKSVMAGFMGGSEPSADDAGSAELRNTCLKLNGKFVDAVTKNINIGTKLDSANDISTLLSLKEIPANEILAVMTLGDYNMFLLQNGTERDIFDEPKGNKYSVFSLRNILMMFQRMGDEKAFQEGKANFGTELRLAVFQLQDELGRLKAIEKKKAEFLASCTVIYKDKSDNVYQLPDKYKQTCNCISNHDNNFNKVAPETIKQCEALNTKFTTESAAATSGIGNKIEVADNPSLVTAMSSKEAPSNEIIVAIAPRPTGLVEVNMLNIGPNRKLSNQNLDHKDPNNKIYAFISLNASLELSHHLEDQQLIEFGGASPEQIEREKQFNEKLSKLKEANFAAEKEEFHKMCRVLYKKKENQIYELPKAKYTAACDCAYAFSFINQSGIISSELEYSMWGDYDNRHVLTDKIAPKTLRNECRKIDKRPQAGTKLSSESDANIIKQMSSGELPANQLFAVLGPIGTSKIYNSWIDKPDTGKYHGKRVLKMQDSIEPGAIEAYSFISPLSAVKEIEKYEAEHKNREEKIASVPTPAQVQEKKCTPRPKPNQHKVSADLKCRALYMDKAGTTYLAAAEYQKTCDCIIPTSDLSPTALKKCDQLNQKFLNAVTGPTPIGTKLEKPADISGFGKNEIILETTGQSGSGNTLLSGMIGSLKQKESSYCN